MTIIVDNEPLQQLPGSVTDCYAQFPSLKAEAAKLALTPARTIENPQNVLYIAQKEYAIVKKDDNKISVMGTDDATTCHIVVLINREKASVCLAHIDCADNYEDLTQMMVAIADQSQMSSDFHLELHIVGGYADEQNESQKLTLSLLEFFHQLPINLRLMGFCVGVANSQPSHQHSGINFPIIYGLALDIPTFALQPAKFCSQVRGPCLAIRACRMFCSQHTLYRLSLFFKSTLPHLANSC